MMICKGKNNRTALNFAVASFSIQNVGRVRVDHFGE